MKDCVFCKIINKEIPSITIFEDTYTMVFMELNPSAPGHLIVINKKHGYSIFEYETEDLGRMMETTKKVSKKVQKALSADSLTLGINHDEKNGVPHLHVHIIPRWDNDKGGIIQSIVNNKPKEDRETIAERIRSVN
ncbi:MAG: hypothetical protein A2186_02550 [Candidatus Levybacteria bacterium RIFOXYA1_FULL_41_10]|nr:MAG: Histidine triad protein [Candidatus Levybacteria bacterium GW2011_GWA1_39_34]KKR51284.1 MAG: Histidine triad protein [Candidatus Levybacteria bacterium GW2011_GWC1_40_19]KKR73835.1 MAG: Histidine triad protein [Candidatus Levybacteria bacterium GW2011_GWC2_40_7]KKR94630.1 MAG: Histidine triad protein [Candidatus Levybacteria bacterium GW2011_GWA2_41_15]KKS02051.1 MAG: Histidine triad protein [Candidatus Levybacteria bacterium GW2011_GWB1_41_21]OGH20533.1 MAG: hypothetical protein A2695